MDAPRKEVPLYTAVLPTPKDSMGLTAEQRMYAWIALGAGIVALIWGLMRPPDNDGMSSDAEQRDRARSTTNNR